jgi:hypothetical protein
MDKLSRQVVLTAIGFFVLGIISFASGLNGSSNKLKAHYYGTSIELVPIELLYIDEQKRTKSSGPDLFVYLTDSKEILLRLFSLKKLKISELVTCKKYKAYCYYTENDNVISYIPSVKFIELFNGLAFIIIGIFTLVFRSQITNRIKQNKKTT